MSLRQITFKHTGVQDQHRIHTDTLSQKQSKTQKVQLKKVKAWKESPYCPFLNSISQTLKTYKTI
jgi:hypothetical protein